MFLQSCLSRNGDHPVFVGGQFEASHFVADHTECDICHFDRSVKLLVLSML